MLNIDTTPQKMDQNNIGGYELTMLDTIGTSAIAFDHLSLVLLHSNFKRYSAFNFPLPLWYIVKTDIHDEQDQFLED